VRTLYLARHGEADGDLTAGGRRQATLLGRRLVGKGITVVHHSPLPRAVRTAGLVVAELGDVPVRQSDLLADYVPHVPEPGDLPPVFAPIAERHLADYTDEERRDGPGLATRALAEFATPADDDRRELIVAHSQIVCWFVRDALAMPRWRWLGINAANAGLTVIEYRPGCPASVVMFNDLSHLPPELRWTGFPEERRAGY
jgi:probable phosphoglycerate mutase